MSLLKRKVISLDPIQKQRKNRQTQYYTLLDRCLQIPNDDKLIIRKNIQQEDERVISLLQKYRKQGGKDLKELQIYLRRFIQRYKQQHPKYPILKLSKGSQSMLKVNKRNSVSYSVNLSKLIYDNSDHQQMKKSYNIPLNKQINSSNMKIKSNLKLNHTFSKQQERNYQQLIRKRKTQKLKISQHKVSVTIQNQSHSTSFYKDGLKDNQSIIKQNKYKYIKQINKQNINQNIEALLNEVCLNQNQSQKYINAIDSSLNHSNKEILLQTMRFKMRIDRSDEKHQQKRQKQSKYNLNIQLPQITTHQSIYQTQIDSRISTINDNFQNNLQIKRKLFSHSQNLTHINKSLITSKMVNQDHIRKPLGQLNLNQVQTLKQSQQNYRNQHYLQQNYLKSSNYLKSYQQLNYQENFNSGKNIHDIKNQNLIDKKSSRRQSSIFNLRGQTNSSLNSIRTVNKQNQQNQVQSQYIQSHRKLSELHSHRLLQDSKLFVNSFMKDKDDKQLKQSRSNRMIFSHRMQQVISGRKNDNYNQQKQQQSQQKSSILSPSYSFREKKKGASKLQFWARIQSTINE